MYPMNRAMKGIATNVCKTCIIIFRHLKFLQKNFKTNHIIKNMTKGPAVRINCE